MTPIQKVSASLYSFLSEFPDGNSKRVVYREHFMGDINIISLNVILSGIVLITVFSLGWWISYQYHKKQFTKDKTSIDGQALQSAELMRNIINTSSDLIFVKDLNLKTLFANQTFASLIDKKPEELYGKTDFENGWDYESIYGNPAKNIRGFRVVDLEVLGGKTIHKPFDPINIDGEIRYFDARKIPLRDSRGNIIGVFGIARDVTERHRLKHQQDNYIKFQNIVTSLSTQFINTPFHSLNDSINLLLQEVGEFIQADRCYIYTYSADLETASMVYEWCNSGIPSRKETETNITTKPFRYVIDAFEPGKPIFIPKVADLPETRALEKDTLLKRGIKSRITLPLFVEDRLIGSMGFHTMTVEADWADYTIDLLKIIAEIYLNLLERNKYEQQLQFQAGLIQNVSGAVISSDINWVITSWNSGAEELYGFKASDVVGEPLGEVTKPEYPYTSVETILDELSKNGKWTGEIVHHGTNNTAINILGAVSIITDLNDVPVGAVSVHHDLRERKQMEEQHLRLTVQQGRIQLLENIISDLSHDIKTPLSSIKLSLHLMLKNPNKQNEYVDRMSQQIQRLTKLVEDILTMSKLDQGEALVLQALELTGLVGKHTQTYQELSRQKQNTLAFNLQHGLSSFMGNESEMNRALGNLIENAINYTPPGETISVETYQQNKFVIFKISDTGIGIRESDLEHIFDRFYRADKARNTNQGGTGLGLAIVKRIIELHEGRIEVESEIGIGTTFTCLFPIAE